jgi:hypothetical protein
MPMLSAGSFGGLFPNGTDLAQVSVRVCTSGSWLSEPRASSTGESNVFDSARRAKDGLAGGSSGAGLVTDGSGLCMRRK